MKNYEILAVSDHDFGEFVATREAIDKKLLSISHSDLKASEDEEEGSYILEQNNGVGVVSINGSLVSRDTWYNRYFGAVSYGEIRRACLQAVDEGSQAILFRVSSGGGEVNGMYDAANIISKLPIPTVTFASKMCSAAYFLGSQADHVYADDFAETGSVGVVLKVYDYTEANKMEGLKVERFRSGDLKAVGDSDFELSAKEREYIKDMMQLYAGKFYDVVSAARGMPMELLEKLGITSGRTFIGEQAKTVNLVDKIVTFEQAMLKAMELGAKHLDKTTNSKVNWIIKK